MRKECYVELKMNLVTVCTFFRRNWHQFVNALPPQIGRQSDRQRAKRRLLINGASPRKGDEALAMAAEALEEEKLQKRNRYKTSNYSSEEGEGIAYRIYKKAGDWWKCVFLHAGDETFVLHFTFRSAL